MTTQNFVACHPLDLAFFCEPLQACTDVLRNIHRDALLAGDNHYRLISLNFYIRFSMMCGHSLSDLEKECVSFAKQMVSIYGYLCYLLLHTPVESHHTMIMHIDETGPA